MHFDPKNRYQHQMFIVIEITVLNQYIQPSAHPRSYCTMKKKKTKFHSSVFCSFLHRHIIRIKIIIQIVSSVSLENY